MGVRPMKDRTREAVFNLIGPAIKNTFAIDLFGGTGAMAIESISRGSVGAVIIERHAPTSHIIRENVAHLKLEDICRLIVTSAFAWVREKPELPETPWTVFICPPYRFFVERQEEMLELIGDLMQRAPAESIVIVESDEEFDHDLLPEPEAWRRRFYPPASVGVWNKTEPK